MAPDPAQATFNQALALHHKGRLQDAEALYRAVLALAPAHADAHNNLALLLKRQGKFAEAEAEYQRSIASAPNQAETLNNLAVLYLETLRLEESEALLRRALGVRGDHLESWNNFGNLLQSMRRYIEAEQAYLRVLREGPERLKRLHALAPAAQKSGRHAEAARINGEAKSLRATLSEARWNLGLLYLLQGRYQEGWPLYEARYDPARLSPIPGPPPLPCPQWQGEPIAGKAMLIWFEQGYGDQIQFVRYLPWLKAQGARHLTLVCKPALVPLLQSIEGLDDILPAEGRLVFSKPDYWAFPMSLALRHGTRLVSIPAKLPYLAASQARVAFWAEKLPKHNKKRAKRRVGLVWAGSDAHRNDRNRSLPSLDLLTPLGAVEDTLFISLQTGPRAAEAQRPDTQIPVVAMDTPIADFADTAAIVHQLDLVITVDTAIAHVAGALNKPCWVLLPWIGVDWRWLQDREDSPWYPGALRLFRQSKMGDWEGVIQQVISALKSPPRRRSKSSTKNKA